MRRCHSCNLVARRDAGEAPLWDHIQRTPHWDLAHCFGTSLPGWLVLVSRRHRAAIADLSEEEAAEVGTLLRRASIALQEVTGCAKTYVVQFAEHPDHPHVHFHIIPRMPNQPQAERSTRIFDRLGVPPEEAVSAAHMNEIALGLRQLLDAMQIL